MLAKAAATASIPTVIGTVYFNSYDSKIIQYASALGKLKEIYKILGALEANLEKNPDTSIIPLINYILSFCEGQTFNVNSTLRKRFNLLCEFRQCKVTEIVPTLSTSAIDYNVKFPELTQDSETFIKNMYNPELQWKLLKCFKAIVKNAIEIYSNRLKQVQIERTANSPPDMFGRARPFDIQAVNDLIRPSETSMCLDLAVLIKDREQDTKPESFRKLDLQILTKFISVVQNSILPSIKAYYNDLHKYVNSRAASTQMLRELPHWEYSMHRIYALLYRTLSTLHMIISIARQLYIPNKEYFNDIRTKLCSENVHDYENLIRKIEKLCFDYEESYTELLVKSLEYYSRQGTTFHVQPNNILDGFHINVTKSVPKLRIVLTLLNSWLTMWQFIQNNSAAESKISDSSDEMLENMLQERKAVDRLASVEKEIKRSELKLKQRQDTLKSKLKQINEDCLGPDRLPMRKISSLSTFSSSSSSTTSPGTMSPNLSSWNSRNVSLSSISSPNLSRRQSIDARNNNNSSNNLNSMNNNVTRQKVHCETKPAKTKTRKRSTSLQSAFSSSAEDLNSSEVPSRSNSLQVGSVLNQKMLQDTVTHLMSKNNSRPPPTSNAVSNASIFASKAAASNGLSRSQNNIERNGTTKVGTVTKKKDKNVMMNNKEDITQKNYKIMNSSAVTKTISMPELELQNSFSQSLRLDPTVSADNCEIRKKVRFIGVPPITELEDPRPKRKGWYKKPEVLHYPPPPTQISDRYNRQEGMAFRRSLREPNDSDENAKLEIDQTRESTRSRITSKLFDKLR
ncbi:hypothetical protein Kpol_1071p6 [Vanderwaltozyma polyspora DSM 70294]|uniref:GLC7-interacting protein 4 n=1 Tax=Vanderwaltozyma polyspora (strain ATCC 22028 / DSM 70294 / BCRC 21397 / CBS 2163 / NBRC 10782 / NRRL Y-8283 / UCD 57-17) TaxID=436907 RepID=A7TRK1_VANPO|nr:uncharacterized protein Kpol_1071p6 [Vanderwaltozyma polyspora DSM 70294]EDO15099.1 hypothetical protein Kpol_1071p6 [Vanderwaltozyma polyspora DSM 70294]